VIGNDGRGVVVRVISEGGVDRLQPTFSISTEKHTE
jgi:hypothetical protein